MSRISFLMAHGNDFTQLGEIEAKVAMPLEPYIGFEHANTPPETIDQMFSRHFDEVRGIVESLMNQLNNTGDRALATIACTSSHVRIDGDTYENPLFTPE